MKGAHKSDSAKSQDAIGELFIVFWQSGIAKLGDSEAIKLIRKESQHEYGNGEQ